MSLHHKLRRTSGIFLSEKQYTGVISTSRNATSNTTDNNLLTYDYITYDNDEFEYRLDEKRKITRIEITITVNQGEGWATDSNLDFYYIPPGETNPVNYIWFGNFNYPGMINYTNYVLSYEISNKGWEFADGIYIKFDQMNIEGGWATLQEFRVYTLIE